jgi:hypothetical protein
MVRARLSPGVVEHSVAAPGRHRRANSHEGAEQRPVEELQMLLQRKDRLVWVDIPQCDEQAIQALTEVFGFHPLAIRDCVERNQAVDSAGNRSPASSVTLTNQTC